MARAIKNETNVVKVKSEINNENQSEMKEAYPLLWGRCPKELQIKMKGFKNYMRMNLEQEV